MPFIWSNGNTFIEVLLKYKMSIQGIRFAIVVVFVVNVADLASFALPHNCKPLWHFLKSLYQQNPSQLVCKWVQSSHSRVNVRMIRDGLRKKNHLHFEWGTTGFWYDWYLRRTGLFSKKTSEHWRRTKWCSENKKITSESHFRKVLNEKVYNEPQLIDYSCKIVDNHWQCLRCQFIK